MHGENHKYHGNPYIQGVHEFPNVWREYTQPLYIGYYTIPCDTKNTAQSTVWNLHDERKHF